MVIPSGEYKYGYTMKSPNKKEKAREHKIFNSFEINIKLE